MSEKTPRLRPHERAGLPPVPTQARVLARQAIEQVVPNPFVKLYSERLGACVVNNAVLENQSAAIPQIPAS